MYISCWTKFLIIALSGFSLIYIYLAIKTIFILSGLGCQGGSYSFGLFFYLSLLSLWSDVIKVRQAEAGTTESSNLPAIVSQTLAKATEMVLISSEKEILIIILTDFRKNINGVLTFQTSLQQSKSSLNPWTFLIAPEHRAPTSQRMWFFSVLRMLLLLLNIIKQIFRLPQNRMVNLLSHGCKYYYSIFCGFPTNFTLHPHP